MCALNIPLNVLPTRPPAAVAQFQTDRYRAAGFALAARAAGWRVLLQPLALAFSQAGNSTVPPAAALELDRQRLMASWGGVLAVSAA